MDDIGYDLLAEEVNRIVSSPYPTALKGLHEILLNRCDATTIVAWAAAKPCQIDSLAALVVDGLPQWTYTLDICTKLSASSSIRDSFLSCKPGLVHDLVAEALNATSVQSRYTAAVSAILSAPLPPTVALPANFQSWFIRLFDHAAEHPSANNIRLVYRVLKSTSMQLISLLSDEILSRFEDRLFDIVRNVSRENQWPGLYCLSIMSILADAPCPQSTCRSQSAGLEPCLTSTQPEWSSVWTPNVVQQYFNDSKSQKTIQLLVLRVMWACTASTGEALSERTETLTLANEIINAVTPRLRSVWIKANILATRKLEDKVCALDLDDGFQFQALCFLMKLYDMNEPSQSLRNHFRHVFKHELCLSGPLRTMSMEELNNMAAGPAMDSQNTCEFVQYLVDFATTVGEHQMTLHSVGFIRLLDALAAAMLTSEQIAEGALLALGSLQCGNSLRRMEQAWLDIDTSLSPCKGGTFCDAAVHRSRSQLIHHLCTMFLKVMLLTPRTKFMSDQQTVEMLLCIYGSSAEWTRRHYACGRARKTLSTPTVFAEAESTPDESRPEWRLRLREQLESTSAMQCSRVEALLARTCADLELRCEDAERPLREEQQRLAACRERHDRLQTKVDELEASGIEQSIRSEEIERERDGLLTELESWRSQSDGLTEQVAGLERELLDTAAETRVALEQAAENAEIASLRHSVALAEKEERVEDLREQLDRQLGELRDSAQSMDQLRQQISRVDRLYEALEQNKAELERLCHQQQVTIRDITAANESSEEEKSRTESRLRELEQMLHSERQEHQKDVTTLQDRLQSELARHEALHDRHATEVARQHSTEIEEFKDEVARLEYDAVQKADDHRLQLKVLQAEAEEKQTMIIKLTRRCETKDKQIAEATSMRANLMAAMGLEQQRSNPPVIPLDSSVLDGGEDMQMRQRSRPDAKSMRPSMALGASSLLPTNNGTPNRVKTRRSRAPPSSRTSAVPASMAMCPLSDISGNSPRRKFRSSERVAKRGMPDRVAEEDQEATFTESDILTGTPGEVVIRGYDMNGDDSETQV